MSRGHQAHIKFPETSRSSLRERKNAKLAAEKLFKKYLRAKGQKKCYTISILSMYRRALHGRVGFCEAVLSGKSGSGRRRPAPRLFCAHFPLAAAFCRSLLFICLRLPFHCFAQQPAHFFFRLPVAAAFHFASRWLAVMHVAVAFAAADRRGKYVKFRSLASFHKARRNARAAYSLLLRANILRTGVFCAKIIKKKRALLRVAERCISCAVLSRARVCRLPL